MGAFGICLKHQNVSVHYEMHHKMSTNCVMYKNHSIIFLKYKNVVELNERGHFITTEKYKSQV